MNYADIILGGILLLGTIAGFRQGLVRALGGFVGSIATIILALLGAPSLAGWLNQKWQLATKLSGWFPLLHPAGGKPLTPSSEVPDWLKSYVGTYVIPPKPVSHGLADFLVTALAFLIILVVAGYVLRLVIGVVDRGVRFTPAGFLNAWGGALVGLVTTAQALAVFVGLTLPFLTSPRGSAIGLGPEVTGQLHRSTVLPYLVQIFSWLVAQIGGLW